MGVAGLVDAIENGRAPRARGDLALHVLDAICALEDGDRDLMGGAIRFANRPVVEAEALAVT